MGGRTAEWLLAGVLLLLLIYGRVLGPAPEWAVPAGGRDGADAPTAGGPPPAVPEEGQGPSAALEVHVLAAGDGEAVLVRCGGGAALIGTGPAWAGGYLADYLEGAGVRRLDAVVIAHGAPGHVGGTAAVARRLPVTAAYDAAPAGDGEAHRAALAALAEAGAGYHSLRGGDRLLVGCAEIQALAPVDEAPAEESAPGPLAGVGGVLLVRQDQHRVLIPGRLEAEGERVLARLYPDLRAEALIVARGGHKDATSSLFLQLLQPSVAVIPVAGYNEEGRPHPEVLARLESAGARVYRTDRDGTVVLTATPQGLRVRREAPLGPWARGGGGLVL